MLLAEALAILMVAAVIVALVAGYPVALTLAGVSLVFALLGDALGVMSFGILGALPQRIFGIMTNEVLLAIPLYRISYHRAFWQVQKDYFLIGFCGYQ